MNHSNPGILKQNIFKLKIPGRYSYPQPPSSDIHNNVESCTHTVNNIIHWTCDVILYTAVSQTLTRPITIIQYWHQPTHLILTLYWYQ